MMCLGCWQIHVHVPRISHADTHKPVRFTPYLREIPANLPPYLREAGCVLCEDLLTSVITLSDLLEDEENVYQTLFSEQYRRHTTGPHRKRNQTDLRVRPSYWGLGTHNATFTR